MNKDLKYCIKKLKKNLNTKTYPIEKTTNNLKRLINFNLDYLHILKLYKILKKIDKKKLTNYQKIKIAFLSNFTTNQFIPILELFLFKYNFIADIYINDYASMTNDILNFNSNLYKFNPEIIILYTNYRDIQQFPPINIDNNEVALLSKNKSDEHLTYWTKILNKINCYIIQNNYELPNEKLYGSLENKFSWSKTSFIREINNNIYINAKKYNSVILNDIDYISNIIGKNNWFDENFWYHSQHQHSIEFSSFSIKNIVNIICAAKGKSKKCLALDLDNTLWGGVVGEVGFNNVTLGTDGIGKAYKDFQKYILDLKNKGIILAVCSKNEEKIAKEVFNKNKNMVLKLSDITSFKANWDNKAKNISDIAKEINIGLDSIVFIDDNPAERDIVRKYLPEVEVPEIPENPAYYKIFIDRQNYFEMVTFEKDDIKRAEYYANENKRKQKTFMFNNIDDYLKELKLQAYVNKFDKKNLARVVQLINKTNQFNLTTIRYSESQIKSYMENKNILTYYVKLKDKFGEYGLISLMIVFLKDNAAEIDTWLMSCRVLNKNVEHFLFNKLVNDLKKLNIKRIIGKYIPTKKNKPVKNLYGNLGFTQILSNKNSIEYEFFIDKYLKSKNFIKEISDF